MTQKYRGRFYLQYQANDMSSIFRKTSCRGITAEVESPLSCRRASVHFISVTQLILPATSLVRPLRTLPRTIQPYGE